VQWLGITSNQLLRIENEVPPRPLPSQQALEISEPSPGKEDDPSRSNLMSTSSQDPIRQITQRDRTVAVGVLNQLSRLAEEDMVADRLMKELQTLLMMGLKCEIQWLDDAGDLVPWLDRELLQRC
jgi:meiotic recombination protein SPO11